MPTSTSQVKSAVVSTVALLTLVPWQLLLAAGFTFTFREHEPTVLWAFVWFLFLVDVPAVSPVVLAASLRNVVGSR